MNVSWSQETLVWGIQILIVTLGIHLFLRFVRATRGNRLIRGVLVTVLGGYLGLLLLATAINAEELRYLLEASTGFLIVSLAIVFQTELRRGIALLGERSLVGRLIKPAKRDTLAQVTKAALSMASQRIGALIAFERETSLGTYIDEGTPIDADVNARLLESLFHPGTALHDGAVIVSNDRVAAAGCFFPLPQEAKLDASLGTRHRAAVGITEDTDSVVLVVSEETGHISIAREGRILSKVDPAGLEHSLKSVLQQKDTPRGLRRPHLIPRTRAGWKREGTWILASLAIAVSLLFLSRRDLTVEEPRSITVVAVGLDETRSPNPGELLLKMPREDFILHSPQKSESFTFTIRGTRGSLDRFGPSPAGVYELPYLAAEGEDPDERIPALASFINIDRIQWFPRDSDLPMKWVNAPEVSTEALITRTFPVEVSQLIRDEKTLQAGFQIVTEGIQFSPATDGIIAIRGPKSDLEGLAPGAPGLFEALNLEGTSREQRKPLLVLAADLRAKGLQLVKQDQFVVVPIKAAERSLGNVTCAVALVSFDPSRSQELARWRIPTHAREIQVSVYSTGLIAQSAELDTPAWSEKIAEILRFVENQLDAYVDISELDPSDGARGVTVRYRLRDPDWREDLAPILLEEGQSWLEAWPLDALTLRLSGAQEILLEEVPEQPATGDDS